MLVFMFFQSQNFSYQSRNFACLGNQYGSFTFGRSHDVGISYNSPDVRGGGGSDEIVLIPENFDPCILQCGCIMDCRFGNKISNHRATTYTILFLRPTRKYP